jgi:hypothetical protein
MAMGVHIRLVASPETRMKRMMEVTEKDESSTEKIMRQQDRDRARLIHDFFGKDINDPILYDAILNTDRFTVEEMADIVIEMMIRKMARFPMPAKPELTPFERDKLTINPDFDFKNDIAARPFEDLTTNDIGMFKWSGIYHQLQKGFFMLRLRIPGGQVTADQLDGIGRVAATYGQAQLDITTRMTVQFHWLRKEDLYKVMEAVAEVGLGRQERLRRREPQHHHLPAAGRVPARGEECAADD